MGVNPTALYKAFEFDGESSKNYGVFLTGEGVFNAPERAVEVVSIPGRNGAFCIDQGRFENIPLTYKAGLVDYTPGDFSSRISDVRNWLCSKVGYHRLEDDYNPGEYRMAMYVSGVEIEHADLKKGEFDIVFDCKPQRFLKSGESKISVTSGDTITNPTLFDAKPMLEVEGYGNIEINGQNIEVHNEPIGNVIACAAKRLFGVLGATFNLETQYANIGDNITLPFAAATFSVKPDSGTITYGNMTGPYATMGLLIAHDNPDMGTPIVFNYGTADTRTVSGSFSCTTSAYGAKTINASSVVSYDGADTITVATTLTLPANIKNSGGTYSQIFESNSVILESTQVTLGNPLYIDLDIGEAYKVEGGVPVSVNNGVIIPAELPALVSGANTITYDNTITKLDIVPRWWRV